MSFSHDGNYLAVIERVDCRDQISVFDCQHWRLVANFPVETTDAVDLSWSPGDDVIAVWDTPVEYGVCMYTCDGRKLATYSAYSDALGVKVRYSLVKGHQFFRLSHGHLLGNFWLLGALMNPFAARALSLNMLGPAAEQPHMEGDHSATPSLSCGHSTHGLRV
jgi:hypothetical protein